MSIENSFEEQHSVERKARLVSGIEIEGNNLCIVTDDGEKVSLEKYLPRNIEFKIGEHFLADFNSNPIVVEYNPFLDPSQVLLSIFHELGHIKYRKYHKFILGAKTVIPAAVNNLVSFVKTNKDSMEDAAQALSMMNAKNAKAEGDFQQKKERESWYYALRLVRRIKSEYNIDVLSGFENFGSVKEVIDYCLSTYTVSAMNNAIDTYFKTLKEHTDQNTKTGSP